MTEEDVAEYVEEMKCKPRKQMHYPNYKPTWHWHPDPEDLPWLAGGTTIILIAILIVLGVI